jgi:hypothetical protein
VEDAVLVGGILTTCLLFLTIGFWLRRPTSSGGRLSLKLLTANVIGWFITLISLADGPGHPPLWVLVFSIFLLINLLLLPMSAAALWASQKEGEVEDRAYLIAALSFLCFNIFLLLAPIIPMLVKP